MVKKSIFLITAVLLSSILLAACSTNGETTQGTPGAFGGTPATGSNELGTPEMGLGTEITPPETTPMVTEPVDTLPAPTAEITQGLGNPSVGATETMTSTLGGQTTSAALDPGRISNLLDFKVMTKDGETIGDVNDVVLDLNSVRVKYVIIGAGGFLGVGEKDIAIPWGVVDKTSLNSSSGTAMSENYGYITLNADKNAIENAPEWKRDLLPQLGQSTLDWDADLSGYWAQYDKSMKSSPGATVAPGATEAPGAGFPSGQLQGVILASDVLGFSIADSTGNSIGEVKDIVFDVQNGQISYVIVSYNSGTTSGEFLVPVPPAAFSLDSSSNALVLRDAMILDTAPHFTTDQFPSTFMKDWDKEIKSFWSTYITTSP